MGLFVEPVALHGGDASHPGKAKIQITDQWDNLGYPNGGYLAALAAAAMGNKLEHSDPLSISASFLGHPKAGEADVEINVLDVKKSLSRATLTLSQGGENMVFFVAAYTDFARMSGESLIAPAPFERVKRESCVSIADLPVPMVALPLSGQFDIRIKPGQLNRPQPGDKTEIEGWISFADGRDPDLYSLILFADVFPPPVFNCVPPQYWGSVPTIEYSVHLKAVPVPGPVYGRFAASQMVKEYMEVDGELWDSAGNLVAVSRQLAKFRKPSRA